MRSVTAQDADARSRSSQISLLPFVSPSPVSTRRRTPLLAVASPFVFPLLRTPLLSLSPFAQSRPIAPPYAVLAIYLTAAASDRCSAARRRSSTRDLFCNNYGFDEQIPPYHSRLILVGKQLEDLKSL